MRKSNHIKVFKAKDLHTYSSEAKIRKNVHYSKDIINLLKKQKFDIVIFDFKLNLKDSLSFLNELKFAEIKAKIIIFTNFGKRKDSLLIRKKDKPFLMMVEKIPKDLIKEAIYRLKESNCKKMTKGLIKVF
ncbi:MAG: hypothetical protein N2490_04765 [Ignavibacteria bacterium]|nr:hypothetical protein [Ignavibacteria bacterium]